MLSSPERRVARGSPGRPARPASSSCRARRWRSPRKLERAPQRPNKGTLPTPHSLWGEWGFSHFIPFRPRPRVVYPWSVVLLTACNLQVALGPTWRGISTCKISDAEVFTLENTFSREARRHRGCAYHTVTIIYATGLREPSASRLSGRDRLKDSQAAPQKGKLVRTAKNSSLTRTAWNPEDCLRVIFSRHTVLEIEFGRKFQCFHYSSTVCNLLRNQKRQIMHSFARTKFFTQFHSVRGPPLLLSGSFRTPKFYS